MINEGFVIMETKRRAEREIGKILKEHFVDLIPDEYKKQIIEKVIDSFNQSSVDRILSMLQTKED